MKNIIVVTGGAGFVGKNLILLLLKKTELKIVSIDNYSSGKKSNHIKNKRVKYIEGHTKSIALILKTNKKQIKTIFHFGEFSRIFQSFKNMNDCIDSNTVGSNAVFNFCLKNKIKLIYSATSATLGNKGQDKNLSPYAFTKSKNLEMLKNLKKWFKMKYEIIYFYNVYGPGQIKEGPMATVIGIFENHYAKNKPLPIVRPGTQSRRFTHIDDTVNICYLSWKKNLCRHYIITNKKSYTINQVAKFFATKSILLPARKGERYTSALSNIGQSSKIFRYFGDLQLKDYIKNFIKQHNNKAKFNN
ncbi:NAD-dependent epimerase/dehydratase family protein [Candidatus Pelagibacter sp.]|nr:NAD-dependent epimerase/dehydratase family protein [Candidatus Pelagibacter sp.]